MNIKEAIEFELKHNFINVTEEDKKKVLSEASNELDLSEDAGGSGVNFYEYVGEII